VFNFFFNWIDPKILRMEKWVNKKVIEPDKIDLDLDKIKKGEVRKTDMYSKPNPANFDEKHGPFITNLTGADLIGFLLGPGEIEAYSLLEKDNTLWWRHRDAGVTQDFKMVAFNSMQEFVGYVDENVNFWECALRTEAFLSDFKISYRPQQQIQDIKGYVHDRSAATGD